MKQQPSWPLQICAVLVEYKRTKFEEVSRDLLGFMPLICPLLYYLSLLVDLDRLGLHCVLYKSAFEGYLLLFKAHFLPMYRCNMYTIECF